MGSDFPPIFIAACHRYDMVQVAEKLMMPEHQPPSMASSSEVMLPVKEPAVLRSTLCCYKTLMAAWKMDGELCKAVVIRQMLSCFMSALLI